MKYIGIIFSLVALLSSQVAISSEQQLTPEQKQYYERANKIWNSLDKKKGDITLPNKVAKLKVPDSFYYLNPKDSEKVLVDVWGNPPGAGGNTLGMLFPANTTPFDDDSWGAEVQAMKHSGGGEVFGQTEVYRVFVERMFAGQRQQASGFVDE